LDLKDVLKRSESLSPRHEKEWKELSSRFSTTEENIIDIDNLSVTSLGLKLRTSEDQLETSSSKMITSPMQQQLRQAQHPKELTLSGGGSIFLKSNRSRDVTPCIESSKLGDFQIGDNGPSTLASNLDEMTTSAGERLKSILREKTCEDSKLYYYF
jgi:UDP-N-acetylenolpyruvoylglucosamine reductase